MAGQWLQILRFFTVDCHSGKTSLPHPENGLMACDCSARCLREPRSQSQEEGASMFSSVCPTAENKQEQSTSADPRGKKTPGLNRPRQMCPCPEPWRSTLSGRGAHTSGAPGSRSRRLCLSPELRELRIWSAVHWPGVSRRHPVHQALGGQASPRASQEQQLPKASRALGPAWQGERSLKGLIGPRSRL